MNKWIIAGVIGHDFDEIDRGLKTSVAVKDGDKNTLWVRVFLFGKNAENAKQWLKKGSKVLVEGKMSLTKADNLVLIAQRVEYL